MGDVGFLVSFENVLRNIGDVLPCVGLAGEVELDRKDQYMDSPRAFLSQDFLTSSSSYSGKRA